jgi:hypothetical protein
MVRYLVGVRFTIGQVIYLLPCLYKAIFIWGLHPTNPEDIRDFLQSHYPLEWGKFQSNCREWKEKWN